VAAVALAVVGCGGDDDVTTVTVRDGAAVQRAERFAHGEVERQSRKTCAVVPRDVLAASFSRVSGDRSAYAGLDLSDNDIGLLYAETVKIRPIALQRAAYEGCLQGLRRQRRR
jgi:hypothetical protein